MSNGTLSYDDQTVNGFLQLYKNNTTEITNEQPEYNWNIFKP